MSIDDWIYESITKERDKRYEFGSHWHIKGIT